MHFSSTTSPLLSPGVVVNSRVSAERAALVLTIMSLLSEHDLNCGAEQDENRQRDTDGIRKTKEGENSQILKGLKNKGAREEGSQTDLT